MARIRKSWGALWGATGIAAATDVGNRYPGPLTGGAYLIAKECTTMTIFKLKLLGIY